MTLLLTSLTSAPMCFNCFYFERSSGDQTFCPKRFNNAKNRDDHFLLHFTPYSVTCMQCGKIFHVGDSYAENEAEFLKHLQIAHPVYLHRAEDNSIQVQDEFSPLFNEAKSYRNTLPNIKTQTLSKQCMKEYLGKFKKECTSN